MKIRNSNPFYSLLTTLAVVLVAPLVHAAPITWGPATTVAGDSDVSTIGAFKYAEHWGGPVTTINGVTFTAAGTNVVASPAPINLQLSSIGSPPGMSSAYQGILSWNWWNASGKTATLNNLTPGRLYQCQVWVSDIRYSPTQRTSITGGPNLLIKQGQFANGTFTADGTSQSIAFTGDGIVNAIQVRELTNIGNWVGTGGATWDSVTTNNFASNPVSNALTTTTFDAAKALLNSVTFADSYWDNGVAIAVTQTTVTVDAAGVSTGTVYFDNSAVDYTIGNASGTTGIAGATAIVKTGSGTVNLTGANTYTGITRISSGTLQYSSNDNQTLSGVISGSGTLGKAGGGTLTLTAANNSHTGSIPISGGILRIGGAGRLNSGNYAGAISFTNGSTLQYSSSNNQTLSGPITGDGGLTKDTSNRDLTLTNAANTYSGITTVSAGRLVVTAATHLSSGATSIVQSGSGQIIVNAAVNLGNSFDLSTTGYTEIGDSRNNTIGAIRMLNGGTLSGDITLSGDSRIGAVDNATATVSGQIGGGFGIDFYGMNTAANGSTVFVISNPGNDYTGKTTILNGTYNTATNFTGVSTTLRLGASNVIPDGASADNVVFAIPGANDNATLILDLNGQSETINGLTVNAGTFATRITNSATGASVLSVGANNTISAFSGTVTDAGVGKTLAINKIGTGTLTLSGVNSYSGDTTVSDGTLALDNPNASNETSTVTIAAAGAKLQLTFGATDSVEKLFIGSTQRGIGQYGHTDSGATNGGAGVGAMDAYFATGTGILDVTAGPSAGFAAWQSANITGQTIDLDHDDDGVPNGVEFFLGGANDTTGFDALPGVTDTAGTLSVTWTKAGPPILNPYLGTYGTHYTVETSDSLSGAWTEETLGGGNITESGNDVKYTFPSPLGTRKFARLRVTGP